MKSTALLFLLSILFFNSTFSQTVFAPVGAEWHHNTPGGIYHCYYDGDSTILGRTVSKVRQKVIPNSSTSWLSDLPTIYTYTVPDTVFVYNQVHARFTPLYIFSVAEGDTLTIPGFYAPGYMSADSTFTFWVDSVRMVTYDHVPLKTVYTSTYEVSTGYARSTYGPSSTPTGAYAERLGCVSGGVYPSCIRCAVIPEACDCPRGVRCYKDFTVSLVLDTSGQCLPAASIPTTVTKTSIAVVPNPASTQLTITAPIGSTLTLLSATGIALTTVATSISSTVINTAHLPAGMYLLHMQQADGKKEYRKVSIVH